jgi:predicted nucleic acid-binding protein
MSTFANIASGATVFVDANTLVYHFINHARYGAEATDLLERIELQQLSGVTSASMVAEMAHRLMTLEAVTRFNWSYQGIANHLRRHPAEVMQLDRYRQAIDELPLIPLQILPNTGNEVSLACDVVRQYGLLTNDAIVVVQMRQHNLSILASADSDFDRVPGLTRFGPV